MRAWHKYVSPGPLVSLEAEGLLGRLTPYLDERGILPLDPAQMARVAGVGAEQLAELLAELVAGGALRIRHDDLLEQPELAAAFARSERARAGGKARGAQQAAQQDAQQRAEQPAQLASLSLSLSDSEEGGVGGVGPVFICRDGERQLTLDEHRRLLGSMEGSAIGSGRVEVELSKAAAWLPRQSPSKRWTCAGLYRGLQKWIKRTALDVRGDMPARRGVAASNIDFALAQVDPDEDRHERA